MNVITDTLDEIRNMKVRKVRQKLKIEKLFDPNLICLGCLLNSELWYHRCIRCYDLELLKTWPLD